MTKMNYMELYEFMLAANQGLNSRRDLLRKTQKSLNTFASGKGGLTGGAADGIANYISEVHASGLQTMIEQLLQRFEDLLKIYVASYTGVDKGGNDFYLATSDYEAIKGQSDSYRGDVAAKVAHFNKITHGVSDIVPSGTYVQQANEAKSRVKDSLDNIKRGIKDQQESWQTYEAEQVRKFDELDEMIVAIERLIGQYSSQKLPQFTGYQKGAFEEKINGKTQQVITTLQDNMYRDRNLVRSAEKKIDQTQKTYQRYLVHLEEERNKREGKNAFYTDLFFMALGVGITIMSGGIAVPALMAFGMALDGLNLYEDYTKMTSGKKYGDNIIKWLLMKTGLKRESTEGVYSLLNLAGAVSGSAGAYKSLVKEGQFVSKGIKTKPLLQNSKQVWRDSTSVKNLFNFADDSKVTGSTAKKVMQAFGNDSHAIGDNVKIAKKHKLLLEGIVPKLSKGASGKVITKTYAKETLKQVTFAGVKDVVIAPAASAVTNSVVGNDTSSIEYKMTNKFAGKIISKPVKTAVNVHIGMWKDGLTGGKVTDKIANRAMLREKFGDNSVRSELDNTFDLLRDMKELYTW
ncbi:T7SS effector LXG polymorphic toxin [Ligilactobacillus murinus]|uniref:T7SS effector LXG polymorphic toxin n=3 Tax=Ligilactobacillus murinus TaxID=1622 RepID=UPI001C3EC569|nr:T7SS effector LXG polymorphic toxin [Ligilactobacillus murinus]